MSSQLAASKMQMARFLFFTSVLIAGALVELIRSMADWFKDKDGQRLGWLEAGSSEEMVRILAA